MDLTTLATDADAEAKRQRIAQDDIDRQRARQNARTLLRQTFQALLGIDIAEADIVEADNSCGVIVDGHRLLLCAVTDLRSKQVYLSPYYLHPDGSAPYLGNSGTKVHDLPSLGRLLSGTLACSGRDPFWVLNELKHYVPGQGWVTHFRGIESLDPPEPVSGS